MRRHQDAERDDAQKRDFPEVQFDRDSPAALALILQLMAERPQPLSAIAGALPRYVIVKKSLRLSREQATPIIAKMKSNANADQIDERDGLKLLWWTVGCTFAPAAPSRLCA